MNRTISGVVLGTLLFLTCTDARPQEASVEEVQIYSDAKGTVYRNTTFFIHQDGSPVRVHRVTARHIPQETALLADAYYDSLFRYLDNDDKSRLRKLARETLTITIDAEGESVVAVKFGIVVYDAFKEFLGSLTGISMDPPQVGMQWEYNPAYLFKFKKYGVVGVFVRQARLQDGRIWNFDEDLVTEEFSERLGEITKEQIVGSDQSDGAGTG